MRILQALIKSLLKIVESVKKTVPAGPLGHFEPNESERQFWCHHPRHQVSDAFSGHGNAEAVFGLYKRDLIAHDTFNLALEGVLEVIGY